MRTYDSISTVLMAVALAIVTAAVAGDSTAVDSSDSGARFNAAGGLIRPIDYRAWPTIGSGLNMAYGPIRQDAQARPPFTNVFVNPDAYRAFLKSGTWPEGSLFILEIRSSVPVNNSATGNNGYFQGDVIGIEAEVKGTQRFTGGWAFFNFSADKGAGVQIPTGASCYSCHAKNGAVENTFVQFYPVLRDVAKERGTLKHVAEVF
jgi:hypothetical protein